MQTILLISYSDKADNANSPVDTADSIAPHKFTIDKSTFWNN